MRTLNIKAQTHGRVLVEDAADSFSDGRLLVLFHGYAQSAEDVLDAARRIPGASAWTLVAIQALHRFYARDNTGIVASWMTRQDRELAIADNVEYVNEVIEGVSGRSVENSAASSTPSGVFHRSTSDPLVVLGFSQGASMAYRAAVLGRHAAAGVIAIAGDIPPELKSADESSRAWPPVLIGAGLRDTWFTGDTLAEDARFLEARGVEVEVVRFDGSHEWTDEFREAAGRWLARHWPAG